MQVSDVMSRNVVFVSPDTKVDAAATLLIDNDVTGLPVVDSLERVVGLVTESDLIVRNAELHFPAFLQILDARIYLQRPRHFEEELRRMLGTKVADVMSAPALVVSPDDPLERAATIMVEKRVNPLPVVKDGKLVGIISRSDIVRLMAREQDSSQA